MERARAIAAALARGDAGAVRALCDRGVPSHLRYEVWALLLLDGAPDAEAEADDAEPDQVDPVIRADARRTRPELSEFRQAKVQDLMVRLLTKYCRARHVPYTQGLNEVVAPFVFVTSPPRDEPRLARVFAAFVDRFLPTLYRDTKFRALHCLLALLRLLLQYVDPRLALLLDANSMSPELYATPWCLTLFARTLPAQLLMQLWDAYILADQPALHVFVCVAFLQRHRETILGERDVAQLPIVLSRLELRGGAAALDALLADARALAAATPASFSEALHNAVLGGAAHSSPDLVAAQLATLRSARCVLVGSTEVLRGVGRRMAASVAGSQQQERLRRFVILDCRPPADFAAGHLPDSVCMHDALERAGRDCADSADSADDEDEVARDRRRFEAFVRGLPPTAQPPHYCLLRAGVPRGVRAADRDCDPTLRNMEENLQWLLQHGLPRLSVLAGGFAECHAELQRIGGAQALDLFEEHRPGACAPCVAVGFERLFVDY